MKASFLRSASLSVGTAVMAVAAALAAPAAHAKKPGGGGGGTTCTTVVPVVDTYRGRATVVDVYAQVLGLLGSGVVVDAPIADTGELGPTTDEGQKEAHLISADIQLPPPPAAAAVRVQAGIADAITKSMGNTTTSVAQVIGLDLNVNNSILVSATMIQSTAKAKQDQPATCAAGDYAGKPVGTTSHSGSSLILGLEISVGGVVVPIPLPNDPSNPGQFPVNTTIEIPGLVKVILNEQFSDGSRFHVNAVHIIVGGLLSPLLNADIVISHADAGIAAACGAPVQVCGPGPECKVKDFMTGGGWITLSGGAKGTFGFNGGYRPGGLKGHLNYKDHGSGRHIQGTDIVDDPNNANDGYVTTGATSRSITYACGTGNCTLNVGDFGEPGGGVDTFSLMAPGNYVGSGPTITRGNIQLHASSCPATSGGGDSGGGGGKPPKGRK